MNIFNKSVEERNIPMKTDARVRYTKDIIRKVFLDLLVEKPLNKITVKEVCELAEINRGTFYKHYQDIYDLMEQLENEALHRFEELLSSIQVDGNYPILVTMLTSLAEYREFLAPLTANSQNSSFTKRLNECCNQYAFSQMSPEQIELLTTSNKQYVYSYLAGGTASIIERWLQTGTKETPQQIAKAIQSLNENTLSLFVNLDLG